MSNETTTYHVGQRVYIGNEIVTIRYVGVLVDHHWGPHQIALGIEWDNPERGKHDGSLNGRVYFIVSKSKSASFIKASSTRINSRSITLVECILERYASSEHFAQVQLGNIDIMCYGFDRLDKTNLHLENLKLLSLERQGIYVTGLGNDKFSVCDRLSLVNHLDLSFNFVKDLEDICQFIDHIPSLEHLVLNGNRFSEGLYFNCIPHNLKVLKLETTRISCEIVSRIISKFQMLRELLLAGNDYTDMDISSLLLGESINSLDLSQNKLMLIPSFSSEYLTELLLSHNNISIGNANENCNIISLDLRHNNIFNISFLDLIAKNFQNLKELRVNWNPLFEDMLTEDMTTTLVGWLPCKDSGLKGRSIAILKLNGCMLRTNEVDRLECDFISLVSRGLLQHPTPERWRFLLEKFGKEDVSQYHVDFQTITRSKLLKLRLHTNSQIKTRFFLKTDTVLRLRGIFSKMMNNMALSKIRIFFKINGLDPNHTGYIKFHLDDDFTGLDSYALAQEQNIYSEVICDCIDKDAHL